MSSTERIMPTLVFVGSTLLIGLLLTSSLSGLVSIQRSNQQIPGIRTPSEITEAAANSLINIYSPSSAEANGTILMGQNRYQQIEFTYSGQRSIECLIVRNMTDSAYREAKTYWSDAPYYRPHLPDGYESRAVLHFITIDTPGWEPANFTIFWQSWPTGWLGDRHWRYHVTTFEQLIEDYGYSVSGNLTEIEMNLKYWAVAYVHWNRLTVNNIIDDSALWANVFEVGVGTGMNATLTSVSPWSLIGQLLSFKLPNVPDVLQYLIAVPFWLAIGLSIIMLLIWAFKPGS